MKNYDYLVVGAGLAGATFARKMTDAGKQCLVIDKRWHVAGNCYDKEIDGINVHMHGPHIWHANDDTIQQFIERFTQIIPYRHQVIADVEGKKVSMPINMFTFQSLFGYTSPAEAEAYLLRAHLPTQEDSLEAWCLSHIGRELYEKLVRGYSEKQWGRSATELPAAYIKRLPVRLSYDNAYFSDKYQGIPKHGYTAMIENMLQDIPVELGVDFFAARNELEELATQVVYTGPIDQLFDYDLGRLEYRGIYTELETLDVRDATGVAQTNYPGNEPWTRIIEYKNFLRTKPELPYTIIGKEYSFEYDGTTGTPSYPVHTPQSTAKAAQYLARAELVGYIVIGRLGKFLYRDMHQVVGEALATVRKELDRA